MGTTANSISEYYGKYKSNVEELIKELNNAKTKINTTATQESSEYETARTSAISKATTDFNTDKEIADRRKSTNSAALEAAYLLAKQGGKNNQRSKLENAQKV